MLVCVCAHVLRIVSRDKILHFKNTLIIIFIIKCIHSNQDYTVRLCVIVKQVKTMKDSLANLKASQVCTKSCSTSGWVKN